MSEKLPEIMMGVPAEKEGKVFARITFSRHGETEYTDQYPDISVDAIEMAEEKGRQVTRKYGVPERIIHSPSVRAKGTADAIHKGGIQEAGHGMIPMHESFQIRPSELIDLERAQELFVSIGDTEEVARQHHIRGGVFTDPSVIESPQSKRTRLYRSLEYLIRSLEGREETRHIVVVSHFELVSLLLADVFGDLKESFGRYNIPAFGEHAEVELIQSDNPEIVIVRVHCDGKTAERCFDRSKRNFV